MGTSFTEMLRNENRETWNAAVGHRFVTELYVGAVPDDVMAGYLIQDHRFADPFLGLLGGALLAADDADARLRFATFIGEVAGDESTYYIEALEHLGASEVRRRDVPDTEATAGFKAIFAEAAETRDYVAALAVLVVTEWLYLDWGMRAPKQRPDSFVYAQWIDLHDYEGFHEFVAFLRSELDRVGPNNPDVARDFFARTVALELQFFNDSYAYPYRVISRH